MRLVSALGIALASVLLVTSCGDDGGSSSDPESSESADSTASVQPTDATESPKSKKELKEIKEKKQRKAEKAGEASSSASPGSEPEAGVEEAKIHEAAQTYSDAFLSGDSAAAFDLLSTRCQDELRMDFGTLVLEAETKYGDGLPITSFEAEVSGDSAQATYTFSKSKLNRDDEPWVFENDRWKQDDC